jgi:hypothetical protein
LKLKRPKLITEETALKKSAKDFLALYRIWTFPLTAGMGSYPGAPDRIGIYQGKPLAIEFKRRKGFLTAHQQAFKILWEQEGGLHIICRSIEDLAAALGIKTLGFL